LFSARKRYETAGIGFCYAPQPLALQYEGDRLKENIPFVSDVPISKIMPSFQDTYNAVRGA